MIAAAPPNHHRLSRNDMRNSSRWPTSLSVISCAERCRITSPIAENSAAHKAISAAMSTFDIGDPLAR